MTGFTRIVEGLAIAAVLAACPAVADDAAARLARALVAAEARDGPASPLLLHVIDQLAQQRERDGALDVAAARRHRALTIAIAADGCDSPEAARAMAAAATLAIERGRYLDAEPLLIIAARNLGRRAGDDRPLAATVFVGLAHIALARGDSEAAEQWARQAVAVEDREHGGGSAAPLRALGAALTAEGRFAPAEAALNAALAQDRRLRGADSVEAARSLSRLAHLYLRQGRVAAALPAIEEAAAIDQARLGPTHPFIADDLYDVGLVYEALGRGGEARRAFTEAIKVLEGGTGRETPRVAYAEIELSRLYRREGRAADADAAFKDARRILNKAEAEEHRRERRV